MKKIIKRALAVMLAIMMCISMLSLNAFAADMTCPTCGGTNIVYEKSGYVCRDCDDYVTPDVGTDEPKCDHEKTYAKDNGNGTHNLICTSCNTLVSAVAHTFVDGKCVCGAQEPVHVHTWNYDGGSYCFGTFEHTAHCACGAVKTESNTGERVYDPYEGNVIKCKYCGWWTPVADSHNWADKGTPDGTGHHTLVCTDEGCDKTRTEECKLVATADGTSVVCSVCGWVKYNDGKPGGSTECANGEHKYGDVYQSTGYSHVRICEICKHEDRSSCQLENILENGTPVGYRCTICNKVYPLTVTDDDQYCKGGKEHTWTEVGQSVSDDLSSVITKFECTTCGAEKFEVCGSPSKLTINYQYADGSQAAPTYSQAICTGCEYSVTSPEIKGFIPDKETVSGTCTDGKGLVFTVTYRAAPNTHTLTVTYEDENGQEILPRHTEELKAGDEYSVNSPYLFGYTPEQDTVNGKMPEDDELRTVKYTPTPYKWTIKYVDEQDNELSPSAVIPYTILTVKGLEAPENPSVPGYKVTTVSVTPPDPSKLGDVEGKVVYEPIHYTLVVNYVDAADNTVLGTANLGSVKFGGSYTIEDHSFSGYYQVAGQTLNGTVDKSLIASADANNQIVLNVYYTKLGTLVVRWVNWDGTELETGSFYEGQNAPEAGTYSGATPARPSDGTYTYSFRGWSDPAVSEDGTVTYTAEFNPTRIILPPEPEQPEPDPDPVETEIEEPDTPLVELPEEIEIEEPDTPLVELPEEIELEDPDVPLADVPQTGDYSFIWEVFALISGAALVWLVLDDRKRRTAE